MGPTYADERRPRSRSGYDQFRDGAIRVARDACPMLECLVIPVALVLGVAIYAAATERLDAQPAPVASAPARGPYDGFRFEYVGAGVRRLIDDGAGYRPGDYRFLRGDVADTIAIAPDGSVLACCDWPLPLLSLDDDTTLHRLGDPVPAASWDDREARLDEAFDLAVAGDGTIWLAGDRVAAFFDGGRRPALGRGHGETLAPGQDSAMWVATSGADLRIVRFDEGQARTFRERSDLPRAVRRWGDRVTGMATTADGQTWVGVGGKGPRRPGGLLRFDGRDWRIARPLGPGIDANVEGVTTGADGSLWVYLSRSRPREGAPWRASMYLARRDASGWAVFDEAHGVPGHYPRYRRSGDEKVLMRAGPDGTVWLTTFDMAGCARLVSFAGGRTAEYLPDGVCVHDLELDVDGRAWVSVEHRQWSQAGRSGVDLYLVDPAR